MDIQVINDLFRDYALVSMEIEHGRLAADAPQVLALSARMAEAVTAAGPRVRDQPVPELEHLAT